MLLERENDKIYLQNKLPVALVFILFALFDLLLAIVFNHIISKCHLFIVPDEGSN